MATYDIRRERRPIARYEFAQQTWASGASGAKTVTVDANGAVEQIAVKVSDNTGDRTATVTLSDATLGTLFTKAGIAENATTVYLSKESGTSDFDRFLVVGTLTATITPSDDPGASGMTVDVYIWLR